MPQKWIPPTAPPGTPLQFFPDGKRPPPGQSGIGGQCHSTSRAGTILIALTGTNKIRRGVPHVDDPALRQQSHEVVARNGAWDFLPGLVPTQPKPPKELTDDEQKLLKLLDSGRTTDETAAEMGVGWSVQRVAAVRREYQKRISNG